MENKSEVLPKEMTLNLSNNTYIKINSRNNRHAYRDLESFCYDFSVNHLGLFTVNTSFTGYMVKVSIFKEKGFIVTCRLLERKQQGTYLWQCRYITAGIFGIKLHPKENYLLVGPNVFLCSYFVANRVNTRKKIFISSPEEAEALILI